MDTGSIHVQAQLHPSGSSYIPGPALNGGLYTGTPFTRDAPWRNFPVEPEAGVYAFDNLRTIAPAAALYMLPGGGLRPGNNTPMMPSEFATNRIPQLNAICVPSEAFASTESDNGNLGFRQYAYLPGVER